MSEGSTISFTLFDTAIGRCAIAWSERGIVAMQLPEATDAATRARMLKRHREAREAPPPPDVAAGIAAIVALTGGEARDLSAVTLDMAAVPDFRRRVYEIARTIAAGATLTYGEIARRLGDPGAARDVGQALGKNPFAIIVPCHRVVAAGGKTGGFSAAGGAATKRRLLAIEGAASNDAPTLFERHGGLDFALRPARRRG
jgi:methylated-DNA-[protein]-cysteine S-methyltransferase